MDFSNINFLLKFIAMIIDIIILLLWCISDYHDNAMDSGQLMHVMFAMTVPGYAIILIGMVILYIVKEEPGVWFQRLFIILGFILFAIVGVFALINCLDYDRGAYPMIMAILCIVNAVLLLIDTLKAEHVF